MLPQALSDTIEALSHLPGVGVRTAERYAYYLLRADPQIARAVADQLSRLHDEVKSCPVTFALIDRHEEVSALYSDPARDRTTVLVVENPLDIIAIERTRHYQGTYHVLGGAISPVDGITPDKLHITELLDRIERDSISEIIIATNPSVEGESTAVLLERMIHEHQSAQPRDILITRLARGLPLGISLEYADQITLSAALKHRTSL
jgi:recombination protein RecR